MNRRNFFKTSLAATAVLAGSRAQQTSARQRGYRLHPRRLVHAERLARSATAGRRFLGTDGDIEIRKSVDIGGGPGGNHLFLVDHKGAQYVDCADVTLPYGERLVDDVLNRTSTADDQARPFLAMELALRAERDASRLVTSRQSPPEPRRS